MLVRLVLFVCLIGHALAKEPPDVDCVIVHLEYIQCSWNKQGTPEVNYTFSSWFEDNKPKSPCTTYLQSETNINTGCNQPYEKGQKFQPFYTELDNQSHPKKHNLKDKVKLNPPTNLTVKNGSDFNLWFYWNQTHTNCVESEVRFRKNNKTWEQSKVNTGTQECCINLPSSISRYELQVRSRVGNSCGESRYWSEWSKPAVWGTNNSTDSDVSLSVWQPVLYVVGALTLILLVIMFLQHERLRIIFIPVVPKPSPILHDFENWVEKAKRLKDNLKTNYNESACPVSEYSHVSQSDSMNSDIYSSSVTTNQTDCSISIPLNDPVDQPPPYSPSPSTV
ncbi:cytokine receptor common subunit gamma-like [Pholidichthys leucotaenia]